MEKVILMTFRMQHSKHFFAAEALKLCKLAKVQLVDFTEDEDKVVEQVPKLIGKGTKEVIKNLYYEYTMHVECPPEKLNEFKQLVRAYRLGWCHGN